MTIEILTGTNKSSGNDSNSKPNSWLSGKQVAESGRDNYCPSLSCLYYETTQGNDFNVVVDDIPLRKPGWGSLPKARLLSLYCSRSIREWATVLEAEGKGNIRLLVITVPNSSDLARTVVARESSYITNRINTALLEGLVSYGIEKKFYFYVKEFTKNGGLHWHYAVHVPKALQSSFSTAWLQKIVHRILKCVSKRSGFDLLVDQDSVDERYQPEQLIVRAEPLRHTVVKYFSKFEKGHGKGRAETKAPFTLPDGTVLSPTLWARASQDLSKETNKRKVKVKFYTDTATEAVAAINELKAPIGGVWSPLNHPNYRFHYITGFRSWVPAKRFDQVNSIFKDAADKYSTLAKSRHAMSSPWLGQEVTCHLFPTGTVRLQMTHAQAKLDNATPGSIVTKKSKPHLRLINEKPSQPLVA